MKSNLTTTNFGKAALLALASIVAFGLLLARSDAEEARAIPPPAIAEPADPAATTETAVLAGGCFWGVQGVFQHVAGVKNAVAATPVATKKRRITMTWARGAPGMRNP